MTACQRQARLARERLTAQRCPKRWGRYECSGPLRTVTDELGRTVVRCDWCDRKARGLCLECPNSATGKSRRCDRCKQLERGRAGKRHRLTHHDRICARERELYMRPAVRAARNGYKRAWRKLNREKVRAQKRRAALRQPQHVYDYMRRYRAKHREHYRRMELARYYRLHPRRPAPHCERCGASIDWSGIGRPAKRCDRCVPPCIRRQREARRAAAALAPTSPPPRRIRAPATTYILGDGRHRCYGAGCRETLEGRTKKCQACKDRDRALALAVVAPSIARLSA
jgi:hypothetical protein